MKSKLNQEIAYLTEASLLCAGYMSVRDNKELIDRILEKENNSTAIQYAKTIFKIINEVHDIQNSYQEIIKKYYQRIDNGELAIIESLFLNLYEKNYESLNDYSKYLSTLPQERINFIVMSNLNNELLPKEVNEISTGDLIKFIRQSNLDDNIQMLIIDITFNWKEHLEVLEPLLQKIVSYLKKYDKELNEIYQFGISNIKNQKDLVAELEKVASFKLYDLSTYFFEIGVVIFQPLAVTLKIGSDDNKVYLIFGALFNFEYVALKSELTKENILEVAKILADPTKLDILKYLAKGQAYGKEIVDMTGLTPATISHHMQALNHSNFVSVHIDMNKTYYQIEKENIQKGINRLKDYIDEL